MLVEDTRLSPWGGRPHSIYHLVERRDRIGGGT